MARPSLIRPKLHEAPIADAVPFIPERYLALKDRIQIDRDKLDLAVVEQADLYMDIADQHVLAVSRRDGVKEELARYDAGTASSLRAAAKDGKITEGTIKELILLDEGRKPLSTRYEGFKFEADLWSALRDAAEQRMRMLRELVSLYQVGYYTDKVAHGVSREGRDRLSASAKDQLHENRMARFKDK